MRKIILASQSPRRQELLNNIGMTFEIIKSNFSEDISDTNKSPETIAEELAYGKAKDVSDKLDSGVILGADTIVVFEGEIYGKPKDEEDANRMLNILSGNTHQVITGVSIIDKDNNKTLIGHEVTNVTFNKLTQDEIKEYIKSGDYKGKAGGYGIQNKGSILINKIEGCYFNVVGLPINKVYRMLKELNEYVYECWN